MFWLLRVFSDWKFTKIISLRESLQKICLHFAERPLFVFKYRAKISRVRRRQNHRQLSEFETGHIISLHEAGIGFREIARRLKLVRGR